MSPTGTRVLLAGALGTVLLLAGAPAAPAGPGVTDSGTFESTGYSPGSVSHCHASGCLPCGPYRDAYHARNAHDGSVTYTYTNPTASGRCPVVGRTIAVDRTVISLGTTVCVGSGVGTRVADDTGGAIQGRRIDIFYEDTGTALNWGRRDVTVTWPGGCSTPPPNRDPVGTVDGVGCSSVRGWAYDPDSPSTSIRVHVYIDGRGYDIGATNVYRSDVNRAYGISGNHGFDWDPPSSWDDGSSHRVEVFAVNAQGGNNPYIGGGSFRCNGGDDGGTRIPVVGGLVCSLTGVCLATAPPHLDEFVRSAALP